MLGPKIITRSLSEASVLDSLGNRWQYHSRSDHHSKVACVAIMFDLLRSCELLRKHVADQKVFVGVNHTMTDFGNDRKKDLDLVICTKGEGSLSGTAPSSFAALFEKYGVELTREGRKELSELPSLQRAAVGSVLVALEAKAAMTAHQRALPRLYDELNSSHHTVHGDTHHAIAAGFVMVNASEEFISPDKNKKDLSASDPVVSVHKQPKDASLVIEKVRQLPRRTNHDAIGFDALGITLISCRNDGTPVSLIEASPAPQRGDIYYYDTMIDRIAHWYGARFNHL